MRAELAEIAGRGSPLHQKHKIYLDAVTIATRQKTMKIDWSPCFLVCGAASNSLR